MARFLKARKAGNNFVFRDRDASPAEGVSLWETCPSLALICDPAAFHEYFTHFDTYVAGDWTITEVGTGSQALADEAGGALLITTGGTENNGANYNKKGESFKLATGKELWFESKVKINDVDQTDLLIGLSVTDTDMLGGVSEGVYFRSVDESAAVAFVTELASTETSTAAVHTLVDATYVKLGFYYDGNGTVYGYVDGVLVATHTTNIPTGELTVAFHFLTGEGAANTLHVDYIRCVQVL